MHSANKLRILILWPDHAGLSLLTSMLKSLGHIIEVAISDRLAVKLIKRNNVDLVLAGVDPLDVDALVLLTYVRRNHRDVPVILLFPRLHAERANEAQRLGAVAVLKYPVPAANLRAAVLQASELCAARATKPASATRSPATELNAVARSWEGEPPGEPRRNPARTEPRAPRITQSRLAAHPTGAANHLVFAAGRAKDRTLAAPPHPRTLNPKASTSIPLVESGPGLQATSSTPRGVELLAREIGLIGADASWRQIIDLAATIAAARTSVLIIGEPGTGKSQLARFIHLLGPDPTQPFVAMESSAIADELSGPEAPGVPFRTNGNDFRQWANKLSQAQGGTFFLAEVAALPLDSQIHLFRELNLRDSEVSAGSTLPERNARFVMSTSENLPALIEQCRFRQELYHRICVVSLTLPPLRHRGTDVEFLAESFRAQYSGEFRKTIAGFTRDALDVLQEHHWPGNVRELEAGIKRAVALCKGRMITSSNLATIRNYKRQAQAVGEAALRPHLKIGVRPLKEALEEPEKRFIIRALEAFNWNRQETARVLEINRTTLFKKMRKYDLLSEESRRAN